MKNFRKLLIFTILACLCVGCFAGCAGNTTPEASETENAVPETEAPLEIVDHAAQVRLDMSSETVKQEVTVKTFVDGDTVHFHVPETVMETGVLKARFLAINTPESTGKIEEYGKKASAFTKEVLSSATSIILESETDVWNPDSTGDRYLVWVWYKTSEMTEYRNLNIEILQNGLAIANSSAANRYGDTCMAAIAQAKAQKLNIYSGQKDPDFYYGEAIELTLKELRTNTEAYNGMKVAFHGVVTVNYNNSVYVESYDPETERYYGMSVYYGFGLNGQGLDILRVGNEVRIVGTVQYYEAGGTWQVSDLNYRIMQPDDPGNIQMLSQGHAPAYTLTDADTFANGKICYERFEGEDVVSYVTAPYAELALGTSVQMQGLTVVDAYTTTDEESSSKGAITLTCEVDGVNVTVRTTVLRDADGNVITQDAYLGKTIDVKGIVDYFDGSYQIKVFVPENINIME